MRWEQLSSDPGRWVRADQAAFPPLGGSSAAQRGIPCPSQFLDLSDAFLPGLRALFQEFNASSRND